MSQGIQKRVQPDLVDEIEAYDGGSFSEKLVKWKNDVDTKSHIDFDDITEACEIAISNFEIDPSTGKLSRKR